MSYGSTLTLLLVEGTLLAAIFDLSFSNGSRLFTFDRLRAPLVYGYGLAPMLPASSTFAATFDLSFSKGSRLFTFDRLRAPVT